MLQALIATFSVGNVQPHQIIWSVEEHVTIFGNTREGAGVESEPTTACRRVAQQDAKHLRRVVIEESRVPRHGGRVARVADQDELSLWRRVEKISHRTLARRNSLTALSSFPTLHIDGAMGIVIKDPVLVLTPKAHWCVADIMEVNIGYVLRPRREDFGHVLPWLEAEDESKEEH